MKIIYEGKREQYLVNNPEKHNTTAFVFRFVESNGNVFYEEDVEPEWEKGEAIELVKRSLLEISSPKPVKPKIKKCAFCGQEDSLNNFEVNNSKEGGKTYRHKNCKFKSSI